MKAYRSHEKGATALIIVMFSVLLFVTITVGFMKLMSDEQVRTNDNELSQGAYDSALAGVEDGKRVLAACDQGNTAACDAITADTCTTVSDAQFASAQANGEVYLKTTSGANGTDFEQAYTCIKISRSTPSYESKVAADSSAVVPLRVASGDTYDEVEVYWFTEVNGGTSSPLLFSTLTAELPTLAAWSTAAGQQPPILRAQLIQMNSNGFNTGDFDISGGGNTLYLYPKKNVGTQTTSFAIDGRRTGTLDPTLIKCDTGYSLFSGYACKATITLPDPIGGAAADRMAYLRLTSLYNGAEFKVVLKDSTSGSVVNFYNVQPSIDSTGRAADVFRRVEARVEKADPNEALLYPRSTVDITGNFCKTITVSTSASDYSAGPCSP